MSLSPWKQIREKETSASIIKPEDRHRLVMNFTYQDMMLIQTFTNTCPDEISGLAAVQVSESIGFAIQQPFILDQPVTGANTNLTEAAAEFVFKLVQQGGSPAPYKFWWHSHDDMNVFWSSEDETTARGFNNQFMLAIVINKLGEFMTRLDMFRPFRLTIYNLPVKIIYPPVDPKVLAFCEKEIKDKVRGHSFSMGGLFNMGRKIFSFEPEKGSPVGEDLGKIIVLGQPGAEESTPASTAEAAAPSSEGATAADGKEEETTPAGREEGAAPAEKEKGAISKSEEKKHGGKREKK